MELIHKDDKLEEFEDSPLFQQIKRRLTKQINKAYSFPHTFYNPLMAEYLDNYTMIDEWLREKEYQYWVDNNLYSRIIICSATYYFNN